MPQPKAPLGTLLPAQRSASLQASTAEPFCWTPSSKRPPTLFRDLYHSAVNAAIKMRPTRALTASSQPQKVWDFTSVSGTEHAFLHSYICAASGFPGW